MIRRVSVDSRYDNEHRNFSRFDYSSKISRDESAPEEWTAGHSGTEVPVRETF